VEPRVYNSPLCGELLIRKGVLSLTFRRKGIKNLKIINAGYEILTPVDRAEILQSIEKAGRTCYKSEDMLTETSASAFTRMLIKRGHEAMIEHCGITVKFICDRGVSHEIVRHRIASYAQESTRYCNYAKDKFGNELTFIRPFFWNEDEQKYQIWQSTM
jgi:thymidylate synthase (FAD)